eukprot:scaffold1596_cov302-Pinguiococcus_pyrenoidosus.AAC.13
MRSSATGVPIDGNAKRLPRCSCVTGTTPIVILVRIGCSNSTRDGECRRHRAVRRRRCCRCCRSWRGGSRLRVGSGSCPTPTIVFSFTGVRALQAHRFFASLGRTGSAEYRTVLTC